MSAPIEGHKNENHAQADIQSGTDDDVQTPESCGAGGALNNDSFANNAEVTTEQDEPAPLKEDTISPELAAKRKKRRKILITVLFVAINIGVILYTMLGDFSSSEGVPVAKFGELLSNNWYYLLLAVACAGLYLLFRALTFTVMLHFMTGKAHFGMSLSVATLGKYYDSITPFAMGGQPFQIYYLRNKNLPEGAVSSLPIAEYSLNAISFVFLSLLAVIFNAVGLFGTNELISGAMMGIALAGILLNCFFPALLLLFSFSEKTCRKLVQFLVWFLKVLKLTKKPDQLYQSIMSRVEQNTRSIKSIAGRKRIIICFIFALLSNIALCSIAFFSLKLFGYGVQGGFMREWMHVIVLTLFVYNSVAFMPTPGNSGAADLSFYWLFNTWLATGTAAAAMLTWRIVGYYLFIFAGLVHIAAHSLIKRKRTKLKQPKTVDKENS